MTTAQQPRYSERLWPSIGVALFCLLMIVSMGIAVGYMYGFQLGVAVTVAITAVSTLGTILYTSHIVVDNNGLRSGNAVLPWEHVGAVSVLDRETTMKARSANAHPAAYFNIRSWIPESVIVQVNDVKDPHPYWHMSSRNASALRSAIESHQNQAQVSGEQHG